MRLIVTIKVKDLLYTLFMDWKAKIEPQIENYRERLSVQTLNNSHGVCIRQNLWNKVMSRLNKMTIGSLGMKVY